MAQQDFHTAQSTLVVDAATYYSLHDELIKMLPKEAQLMALEFGLASTVNGQGEAQTWLSDGIPGSTRETGIVALWELLCDAEMLVGYNILAYDLPILYFETVLVAGHRTGWPTATVVDLFAAIRSATGRSYSLHDVAHATLGRRKSTSTRQSAEWLRKGETQLVAEYCALDVRLCFDLYQHILADKPLILPRRESEHEPHGYRLWLDQYGHWLRLEPTS